MDEVLFDSSQMDYELERTYELLADASSIGKISPEIRNALSLALEPGPEVACLHHVCTDGTTQHIVKSRLPRAFVELMSAFGTYEVQ